MKPKELLARAAQGNLRNVKFADLQRLAEAMGYRLKRVNGSHHVYVHPDLDHLLNIQPNGRQAKPYQVRQVAEIAARYSLRVENDK
jgi:predicted RNA binding protein YcfA (HicA-like mRNA interferase family)